MRAVWSGGVLRQLLQNFRRSHIDDWMCLVHFGGHEFLPRWFLEDIKIMEVAYVIDSIIQLV